MAQYWDDVNGGGLPAEELEWPHKMKVYDKVDVSQAWVETNRAPISFCRCETDKGSSATPSIRTRVAVRWVKAQRLELTTAELFPVILSRHSRFACRPHTSRQVNEKGEGPPLASQASHLHPPSRRRARRKEVRAKASHDVWGARCVHLE